MDATVVNAAVFTVCNVVQHLYADCFAISITTARIGDTVALVLRCDIILLIHRRTDTSMLLVATCLD